MGPPFCALRFVLWKLMKHFKAAFLLNWPNKLLKVSDQWTDSRMCADVDKCWNMDSSFIQCRMQGSHSRECKPPDCVVSFKCRQNLDKKHDKYVLYIYILLGTLGSCGIYSVPHLLGLFLWWRINNILHKKCTVWKARKLWY